MVHPPFSRRFYKRMGLLILVFSLVVPLSSASKILYPLFNFAFGAKSLSLGNAFTAVADDLTAVFWNPAGLSGNSQPVIYGNFRSCDLSAACEPQENILPGMTRILNRNEDAALKNIDFISISVPAMFWNVKWNFALSYTRYIPYNAQGSLRQELVTTGVQNDLKRDLTDFSGAGGIDVLGFSTAVHFSQYFFVGVTLQYFFNSGRTQIRYESGDLQFEQEITEAIRGQNIIIGGLFKPDRYFSLGMVYQTGMSGPFEGESRILESGNDAWIENAYTGEIHLPPRFALGILFAPQENWRLAYDFSQVLWKSGTIRGLGGDDTRLPFPVRDDDPSEQVNNLNHRLGTEIDIKIGDMVFQVRGGLFWERQLFLDAANEKVWIKGFSLGLGFRLFSRVKLELAYMNQRANWLENGYFDSENMVANRYRRHIFALALTTWFATPRK